MKKFLIIGSGPYCIGSSVEFDWCGVQVLRTLRKYGHQTVFINSNPETVSTDFDECDRLYFEELTLERVLDVYDKEEPDGVIFSTGGQLAQNLAVDLAAQGIPLVGTPIESINHCEDRNLFSETCDRLEIDQPIWQKLSNVEEAKRFANEAGYPVLIRPSFVLSGAAMAVAMNPEDLEVYLETAVGTTDSSVVISKFEENSKEVEFDGVAQNGEIIVSAISEHVENAGVHSGDATIVLPPQNLYVETVRRVRQTAAKLAKELNISGPFNIQFLAKDNHIKVIECNLRASRSFPFASKVLGQNFMDIATRIWLDEKMENQEISLFNVQSVGVKAAQFSFSRLKGSDPALGVEMSSTGEVACFGDNFEDAFTKSMDSIGISLPEPNSTILVSLGKIKEKVAFVPLARKLKSMGYSFRGTDNTAKFLTEQGVDCESVFKISSDKHPNVVDCLENGEVSLVLNTSNKFSHEEKSDGYLIRRKAIDRNIPLFVNLQLFKTFVMALEYRDQGGQLSVKSYAEKDF